MPKPPTLRGRLLSAAIWASFVVAAGVATLAALSVLGLPLTMLLAVPFSRPSDEVLMERFARQRAAFDELRALAIVDRAACTISPAAAALGKPPDRPPSPEAAARIRRRIALLNELGVRRVEISGNRGEVAFAAWPAEDLRVSKGFAFRSEAPRRLVADLDAYVSDDSWEDPVYRPLGGGWYLYVVP